MFERYLIMTQEFRNIKEKNQITGFQVKVRIPYYRGVWLSTIDSLELKVDNESFAPETIVFAINHRRFTSAEREAATDVRWFFGDPATLIVSKPGGLAPGMHTVSYAVGIRKSYIPKSDPEKLFPFDPSFVSALDAPSGTTKRMTLVE